jgi:hypothetical protein
VKAYARYSFNYYDFRACYGSLPTA